MKQLLWILFVMLFCTRVLSQETPEIVNLRVTGYGAQNQIWSIAQDNSKLTYFANASGLSLFDGANWDTLQMPEKQIVRCVNRGKNDELFVGAYGEFGFWKRNQQHNFVYHSLSKDIPLDKVRKEEIWHILCTPEAVFFQSFSTLYKYDYHRAEIISTPGNIMFFQAVNGRYFIQAIGQGIYEYRQSGFELCDNTEFFAKKTVVSILPFANDRLLIFTANDGVFIYDFQTIAPWTASVNIALKKDQINRCLVLKNADMAIGTILDGLYIVSPDGQVRYHLSQSNGLQNNTVLSLLEDEQNYLWVGLDHGADRISLNSPLAYFKDFSGKMGTTYTAANFNNQLYLGTNRGVFCKTKNGAFNLIEGSQGQVWFLKQINNQLICGHNNGTFSISRTNAINKIATVTGGWTMQNAKHDSTIWIQGNYTGLAIFKIGTNGELKFSHRVNGFSEPVKQLINEDKNHCWVQNPYKGFYRLHLNDDLTEVDKIEELNISNKKSAAVKSSITAINGKIYVQSTDGIFISDFSAKEIQLHKTNEIEGTAIVDQQMHLLSGFDNDWFCVTKDKVIRQKGNQKMQFFTSLVYVYECIENLNNEMYLLGKENGYCLLNKNAETHQVSSLSAPIISKVSLQNEKHIYPLSNTGECQLSAQSNELVFSFSQPEILAGVRFRYILEGFDKDWSEWQSKPSKEFTNLAAGNYIFKVKSDVSDNIASFTFTILPPWYLTIWAKVIYVLSALFLFYLLERWYLMRLELQKKKLMQQQQQVMEQLQLQNENILLQNTIQSKTKEIASSAMNVLEKNQILIKIKETLNEVRQEVGSALPSKYYQRIINVIDEHLSSEQDWLLFETNFNEVHDHFFKRLINDFPDLTPGDLKLAAYLKMDLSSKELAQIFNISVRGMENKRYRLRQKMGLKVEDNVVEFLMKY
ncbi:MAG: triple tyrosine motif-containing protein [Saprospiraceae bacterium]